MKAMRIIRSVSSPSLQIDGLEQFVGTRVEVIVLPVTDEPTATSPVVKRKPAKRKKTLADLAGCLAASNPRQGLPPVTIEEMNEGVGRAVTKLHRGESG
jgi:hypothetical protein